MALRREWIPSPNYSSRGGTAVRLVVVHTAEGPSGPGAYQELGAFFANPSSGVSSHTGIDDTPGVIGEYTAPGVKAWTQGNANPYSVATELCGFAAWSYDEWWRDHAVMLENCAAWIGEECDRFGIPCRRLSAAEAQGGAAGMCGHVDLGAAGGGHWDPGPGFPWADVMEMAGGEDAPMADTSRKGHNMIASTDTGEGYWTVTSDGAVSAFGDAQYEGGGFAPDVVTGEIIGIAGKGRDGYWLYASDGGILAFGSAQYLGRPDRA
jgi:hypothetical protein